MKTAILVLALNMCLLISVDAARVTTLYTIRKFDFWFNNTYFKDITAFYQPVRGKWGRIHVNLTAAQNIRNFWIDFNTNRQDDDKTFQPMSFKLSFNVCDLINNGSSNIMFQMILGLERVVRNLFTKCPVDKGTVVLVPDQIIPSIPRTAPAPMLPSGYYKFTFDFHTTEPYAVLGKMVVEFNYRGFW